MADYFEIAYVNTLGAARARGLPGAVESIRDWSWDQSAYVRWSQEEPGELKKLKETELAAFIKTLKRADLVVLDWSSKYTDGVEEFCRQLRIAHPDLPILFLRSDPGRSPARDNFVAKDARALVLKDTTNPARIAESFRALQLSLPPTVLKLHPDERDLATKVFVEWVGRERLAQAIQKYFPGAKDAYLMPVGGGWSDAKLCRLFIDNEQSEYFLKFFTDRKVYTLELLRHAEAKAWLGADTVGLRLIPDIEGGVEAQNEAFPDIYPPRFPVCYESASTRHRPRRTLKELYHGHPDERFEGFAETAVARLLDILAAKQPLHERDEPPWSDSGANCFRLSPEEKVVVLETVQDLSMYGPHACGEKKWDDCVKVLQNFIYGPLPRKLYQFCRVVTGHTHGDPNPRNCLLHPENSKDLLLIDCGDYRPDGRLVSDLALIERDLKLLLMGTERGAGGYFDLETAHLPDWCHSEREAVSRGLAYTPGNAPAANIPAGRAYRLVGRVRERAGQLSGDRDPEGRHYFAALLFWTLDVLKYPTIRPTKKLLGLFSASEIIPRFL